MPVTAIMPGLPTGLGATVIQANSLTIPAAEYAVLTWQQAQKLVNDYGRNLFLEFPSGNTPDPNWAFYTRTDMTGSSGSQKTLIGVNTRSVNSKRSALNTSSMVWTDFPTLRRIAKVYAWHFVEVTLSNGSKYLDMTLSIVAGTAIASPEDGTHLAITNGYQGVYEAMSLTLKPVAAGAPLWDPMYASLAGLSPNV